MAQSESAQLESAKPESAKPESAKPGSKAKLQAMSKEARQSVRSLLGKVAKIAGQAPGSAKAAGGDVFEAIQASATQTAQRGSTLAQQAGELAQDTGENLKASADNLVQRASPIAANVQASITETASSVADRTGQLAQSASAVVGSTANTATTAAADAVEAATERVGKTLRYVNSNPLLKRAAGFAPSSWLLGIANKVDVEQAAEEVERLRAAHPNDAREKLAHRIMVQKTLLASGMGFASSVVPGAAAALFALDLAATVMLQVEMIYQIAMIYGLDLSDPQREGEMLAIFGLAMGGQKATQAGATYLARAGVRSIFENIPVAGALIGASSNAVLNYAIGYAACRFYQNQANEQQATPLESEVELKTAEQAGEDYLTETLDQQRAMDQLLAHAAIMAYPDEQWDDIPKVLEQVALPVESKAAIAQHLESPEPLGQLLQKLTPDFALPLVAQCQRLAQADGDVTAEEQQLLDGLKAQLA